MGWNGGGYGKDVRYIKYNDCTGHGSKKVMVQLSWSSDDYKWKAIVAKNIQTGGTNTISTTKPAISSCYDFPAVNTDQFVHGICAVGASRVKATSNDLNLTYTQIPKFQNDMKMWADRDYIANDVYGAEMCQGGI